MARSANASPSSPTPHRHTTHCSARPAPASSARAWPDRVAAAFPTHAELPDPQRRRAAQLRPSPTGWLDLAEGQAPPSDPAAGHNETVAGDLIARLVDYLAAHTPPATIAAAGPEHGLARVCWVLTGFEDAYRTGGRLPAALALCQPPGQFTRGQPPRPGPTCRAGRARRPGRARRGQRHLDRLAAMAGHPPAGHALGYAGPVFVPHWADGGLLLGPGPANTLLDVKTVTTTRDGTRVARWLYQLLGYTWLDPADRYKIRDVGLYLARHGVLLTWPLNYFTATLLDRTEPRVAATRHREFLKLATRMMAAEGADPTWLTTPAAPE